MLVLTADQLLDAYERNETRADNNYGSSLFLMDRTTIF